MPWNQPGGENKDPWSGGGRNNQGPPDLDEVFKKLSKKLGGFGGKSSGGGVKSPGGAGLVGIVLVAALIWLASGLYIVGEGERGIVMRFGEYQSVSNPGPHWRFPYPFEAVEKVDMEQVRSSQHRASMLTQDENIVDVEMAVQYRVKDPVDYLLRVRTPDNTLQQAVESALRESVGKQKMDYILNEGRQQIASATRTITQEVLDNYRTGLEVTTVNLQQSQPPEMVQDAFIDAIKAREDNIRFINEAEAYANGILPLARGEAARAFEEAAAYKAQVTARAEGDAIRFTQIREEYEKAPGVTRERLFLETVEEVFAATSKVIMDSKGSNSMMYLPLDKLLENRRASTNNKEMPAHTDIPSNMNLSGDAASRAARSERNVRETR